MNSKEQTERSKKLTWTDEEDSLLKKILEESGVRQLTNGTTVLSGSWGDIARHLPGRSAKQCRERWCYNLSPSIRRDDWSIEEDAVLVSWQSVIGNQWATIARKLIGRTENSVKIRFKSIRRARKRVWTAEDDEKLLALHTHLGSRWEKIADALPGRTRNSVKTRCLNLRKGVKEVPYLPGSPAQILFNPDMVRQFVANIMTNTSPENSSENTTSTCALTRRSSLLAKRPFYNLEMASERDDESASQSTEPFSRSCSEEECGSQQVENRRRTRGSVETSPRASKRTCLSKPTTLNLTCSEGSTAMNPMSSSTSSPRPSATAPPTFSPSGSSIAAPQLLIEKLLEQLQSQSTSIVLQHAVQQHLEVLRANMQINVLRNALAQVLQPKVSLSGNQTQSLLGGLLSNIANGRNQQQQAETLLQLLPSLLQESRPLSPFGKVSSSIPQAFSMQQQ